jgi:hypothetical protein
MTRPAHAIGQESHKKPPAVRRERKSEYTRRGIEDTRTLQIIPGSGMKVKDARKAVFDGNSRPDL